MPTDPCTAQRRPTEARRPRAARRPADGVRRPVAESALRSRAADAVVNQWLHELAGRASREMPVS